jgi:hypothetical protein
VCDRAKSIDEESVGRGDRGEDRPPQRSPGGVMSFPVSRIAERNRSFLAHPSNAARGKRPLLGRGEQASVLRRATRLELEGRMRCSTGWSKRSSTRSMPGEETTESTTCAANCARLHHVDTDSGGRVNLDWRALAE